MKALILDASDPVLGILLYNDGAVYTHKGDGTSRRHTAAVLTETDNLLHQAGIAVTDLNIIAAVTGPGSFTGIRIGVATANALAYAAGAKRIALTSLEPLLHNMETGLALLDCKNDNYYALLKENGKESYRAVTGEEARALPHTPIYKAGFDAEKTLAIFLDKAEKGAFVPLLTPFYMKQSSAEQALDKAERS